MKTVDEQKVLDLLASRIERGREIYGGLDLLKDKRDLSLDVLEELLDACIYLSSLIVQIRNKVDNSLKDKIR